MKEKKISEKQQQYEDRERQREEEEKKSEEWKLKIIEDQKKLEQEEYSQWKDQFTVEEVGDAKLSYEDEIIQLKQMLDNFIKYIKVRKVVQLEDLSSEFKISTKDVIDRIKSLEMNKQLNGIIDERGKYIYLTEQELLSVKNFIEAKGRVSRQELLRECNQIIKLDSQEQDQLANEEQELLESVQKEIQEL